MGKDHLSMNFRIQRSDFPRLGEPRVNRGTCPEWELRSQAFEKATLESLDIADHEPQ